MLIYSFLLCFQMVQIDIRSTIIVINIIIESTITIVKDVMGWTRQNGHPVELSQRG